MGKNLRIAAACWLAWLAGFTGARADPAARTEVSFRLGDMELTSVLDAMDSLPNDGKVFGVTVGSREVGAVLGGAGLPRDRIPLSINVLLARAGSRVMLFDTGLGAAGHGALAQRLAKLGVAPADITDVFVTHAHADHVGGLLAADGTPAFGRARIHVSAPEWAAMQAAAKDRLLVRLIGPQVETFKPGGYVIPEVLSVDLPGHTLGHTGFEIQAQGHKLLDIGDIVHSSVVSLARPAWRMGFDEDQALGEQTRLVEVKELASDGELVFSPHFPFPGVGSIVTGKDGLTWRPARL